MYVYMFGTYAFRIIHPAPFVHDETTVAQETRLAGQKG